MEQQLLCYKTLPEWNSDTLPEAFRQRHNTQSGTWAKLTVLSGNLTFAMMTEDGATTETWQLAPKASRRLSNRSSGIASFPSRTT